MLFQPSRKVKNGLTRDPRNANLPDILAFLVAGFEQRLRVARSHVGYSASSQNLQKTVKPENALHCKKIILTRLYRMRQFVSAGAVVTTCSGLAFVWGQKQNGVGRRKGTTQEY